MVMERKNALRFALMPIAFAFHTNLFCSRQIPDAHTRCYHFACAKASSKLLIPIEVLFLANWHYQHHAFGNNGHDQAGEISC